MSAYSRARSAERVSASGLTTAALQQLLDRLPHAIVVFDAGRRIVYCNAAARSIAQACALTIAKQRLQATTDAVTEQVDGALRMALNGRPTLVRCGDGRLVSHWLFHPYHGDGFEEGGVIAFGPTTPSSRPIEIFADEYALSRAERRLLRQLVEGNASVAGVAISTARSVATVRSHLRNLFQKTGTGKQSELLLLVSSLPAVPLEPEARPRFADPHKTRGSSV